MMLAREVLTSPVLDARGLDLASASRLTYLLEQTFTYTYPSPVRSLRHRLHVLPPRRHDRQHLTAHRLDVTGAVARRRTRQDSRGNTVIRLHADQVDAAVTFAVAATVERRCGDRPALLPAAVLDDPRLRRASELTRPDDRLRDLAAELRSVSADSLELSDAVCGRVFDEMTYEYGPTGVSTTAAQAWALRRGVCQDDAHVMIAVCRELGLPTRYVSGHLIGQGGTHAWVEVLVPAPGGAVAVAFDPCHGRRADARYLTVATGRDYHDVPPTSGSYVGAAGGTLATTRRVDILAAA